MRRFGVIGFAFAMGDGIWLWAQEPPQAASKDAQVALRSRKRRFRYSSRRWTWWSSVSPLRTARASTLTGLKPADFKVTEDGITQKLATFSEGSRPAMEDHGRRLDEAAAAERAGSGEDRRGGQGRAADAFVGTNVFVLFDTSNFMYRGFVYAKDAIADFVRGLDKADSVAVYTFSRNLSRAANLTPDRNDAIMGLRKAVAGDDTALYNGLLLTLRDAAKVPGRKVVIVFSNGPDNASMVAPDDVARWPRTRGFRST